MLKKLFILCLSTTLLTSQIAMTEDTHKTDTNTDKTIMPVKAPQFADLNLEFTTYPDTITQANATDYQTDIEYTPTENSAIFYFNNEGKASTEPVKNGFYRKILGETKTGQLVIQDFYQDNGSPQTAPSTIIKGADLNNFSSNIINGRIIWYQKNGEISSIQEERSARFTTFYNNKQILAQIADDITVIYAIDGKTVIGVLQPGQKDTLTLYYPNGQALSQTIFNKIGENYIDKAWDEFGNAVDPKTVWDLNKVLNIYIKHALSIIINRGSL